MSTATAASNAYFAQAHTFPQTFTVLTNPPTGQPLLQPHNMTQTATTLKGRNGWTLQLISGATTSDSDQTNFQC
jgi:hypothetical protein